MAAEAGLWRVRARGRREMAWSAASEVVAGGGDDGGGCWSVVRGMRIGEAVVRARSVRMRERMMVGSCMVDDGAVEVLGLSGWLGWMGAWESR